MNTTRDETGVRKVAAALIPGAKTIRRAVLVPAAALLAAAGLLVTGSPAQAATYYSSVKTYESSRDSGGIDTSAILDKAGFRGRTDYGVWFYAYGETVSMDVESDMYSRGKVTVVIYDRNGQWVDTQKYTVGIGARREINLDIPGYTNDLPEGYGVYTKICVGLSDTCTPYVRGNA
ncbi:hypothetical protein FZ103_15855 [Streptomonospora sp. PA3]|uniref:hypothetical protein n=1 Tax=Streptomonospora sp. PA3 TaxID=2607326 RepID=UPI0012DF625A|nr:hypothetical protein [Streptomonospora sp. PA3]MUL42628.1 hypothetical protein [Streptomonospora sp. PA3]